MTLIQKFQEAEMCIQGVRLDSLEFEPVRVGPVFSPAGNMLLSPRRNASQFQTNIIEFVYKFDSLVYSYIAICLFLVLVMLVYIS